MFSFDQLHRYRKLISTTSLLAAALTFGPALRADIGLGLSPMRAELKLAPGATYTGTLRLVNEGTSVRARTSLLDFNLDTEQTPQFEENLAQEAEYSCRRWLTVNPMETEVAANSQTLVRYTLRVPPTAQPRSYHCAIAFTSLNAGPDSESIGIRTAVRIVSALYITVGTPQIEGKLSGISLEQVPGSKDLRAVVVMENSGKLYYRPTGSVAILDPEEKVIESYEINPVPVLPARSQRLLFPLKQLTPGQPCKIRVRVDLGTGEVEEGIAVVQASVVPVERNSSEQAR